MASRVQTQTVIRNAGSGVVCNALSVGGMQTMNVAVGVLGYGPVLLVKEGDGSNSWSKYLSKGFHGLWLCKM